MTDVNEFDGVDKVGRKKPTKRPPIKFTLQPREDGELIEDWVKRETERLVSKSAECKAKKEQIQRITEQKSSAGLEYGDAYNQLQSLKAQKAKALRDLTREWRQKISEYERCNVRPAKRKMRDFEREKKKQLAKFNTIYNRYFNAVKTRIFQNMKSLCDIKHTWADKATKRSIQNSDAKGNRKPNARKPIEELEKKVNAS